MEIDEELQRKIGRFTYINEEKIRMAVFDYLRSNESDDCSSFLSYMDECLYANNIEAQRRRRRPVLPTMLGPSARWDMPRLRLFFHLLENESSEITKDITSYLGQTEYGWRDFKTYLSPNNCLRTSQHCRISEKVQTAAYDRFFYDLDTVFLDDKYGAFTSLIFAYCVTSLFTSRLKASNIRTPFPLHIGCERSSNILPLIERIAGICDVNVPLHGHCGRKHDLGACLEYPAIYALTGNSTLDLRELMYMRDIPVIVTAFGMEEEAESLLREIANQHTDQAPLGRKSRLNSVPIFVSERVSSSGDEILSLDMNGINIDPSYIDLLDYIKPWLAGWIYELLFPQRSENLDKAPLPIDYTRELREAVNKQYGKVSATFVPVVDLGPKDLHSIAVLSYFLQRFLVEMRHSFQFHADPSEIKFHGIDFLATYPSLKAIASSIAERVEKVWARLHANMYKRNSVAIDISDDSVGQDDARMIRRKGDTYLKRIISAYEGYNIKLSPKKQASYKNGRYIFPMRILPGTSMGGITTHADAVKRIAEVPFFQANITDTAIELIVSEKPLNQNSLETLLADPSFTQSKAEIPYAVGYNAAGDPVIEDVADFIHALIGGATGAGKSSALHSMLMSIVMKQPSDKVKLLMMDFGGSYLSIFKDAPHNILPGRVISDDDGGVDGGEECLEQLFALMKLRENQLASLEVQEKELTKSRWPYVICVIDELPVLIDNAPNVIPLITRFLELARKYKIILVFTTQEATKRRISIGSFNIPTRIAFQCSDHTSSRAILRESGAEKLAGIGSMYLSSRAHSPIFVQGAYMDPLDIEAKLKESTWNPPTGKYDKLVFPSDTADLTDTDISAKLLTSERKPWRGKSDLDILILDTCKWIVAENMADISANKIKGHFHKGQNLAGDCIEAMENAGIVAPRDGQSKRPRKVDLDAVKQFLKEHGELPEVLQSTSADPATSQDEQPAAFLENSDNALDASDAEHDSETTSANSLPAMDSHLLHDDQAAAPTGSLKAPVFRVSPLPQDSPNYQRILSALTQVQQRTAKQQKFLRQEVNRLSVSEELGQEELLFLGAVPVIVCDDDHRLSALFYALCNGEAEHIETPGITYKDATYPVLTVSEIQEHKIQLYIPKAVV